MVEQDTIKLLRECDAGVKMGASSLDDALEFARGDALRRLLRDCRAKHDRLDGELRSLLAEYRDEGREPNPITQMMSEMGTKLKLTVNGSDSAVAELMTDGCNMGVKSLSRYLNQYQAADERSKDLAKRLIAVEDRLAVDLRAYL